MCLFLILSGISYSSCIVRVYVIGDDAARNESQLNSDKLFLTAAEAYDITAKDDSGTPADAITGKLVGQVDLITGRLVEQVDLITGR